MAAAYEPGFDPAGLDAAQRHGDACVVCRKRWPRPRVRVGHVPGGGGVFACDECATMLPGRTVRRPERGPDEPSVAAGRVPVRPGERGGRSRDGR
ncbi:hypothetical protein [Actinomadura rayongensis]|uniref:Uncharacterized protein n=1 Tax=Actinomadura rayongensis TaxID=1429076 RepID=A0A6I4W5D8_9ACTN|nr:hypothetical protein [Actinomadura rayongensis]MXQ63555.1 hypothetical protein [Actinomadura rayongensis]